MKKDNSKPNAKNQKFVCLYIVGAQFIGLDKSSNYIFGQTTSFLSLGCGF
jgi:hypothetical protein